METFNGKMKMADLVESNYPLLRLIERMGFRGSFGERTVDEICRANGADTGTFLMLCNVYSVEGYSPSAGQLRSASVPDILSYLRRSHDYYLSSALISLSSSIEALVAPCNERQQSVIRRFFADYKTELDRHFEYEEGSVIPYVSALIAGRRNPGFSIRQFEENHSNIDETLSDLKNLVMKSLPSECDSAARTELLMFIYELQEDLARHTKIEDEILVPMVRLIEDPDSIDEYSGAEAEGTGTAAEELSDREKEILISVAQGLLNKEIADRHNISINTVITHRKNITRKTGIRTVAGLTVYAILNNLIDINSVE